MSKIFKAIFIYYVRNRLLKFVLTIFITLLISYKKSAIKQIDERTLVIKYRQ